MDLFFYVHICVIWMNISFAVNQSGDCEEPALQRREECAGQIESSRILELGYHHVASEAVQQGLRIGERQWWEQRRHIPAPLRSLCRDVLRCAKRRRGRLGVERRVCVEASLNSCATGAICTSSQLQDKTSRRRGTTAIQFPPLTLTLIPSLLCSLILRPQGPHPPRPAKPPLIIDLRKIHIQYAHWHKETHRCVYTVST